MAKQNNMKKIHLLIILTVALQAFAFAQTSHIITTSGFTFSPDSIHANVGDTIIFNVNFGTHPLQQVSSTTWSANQATPLSGGFAATSGTTFSVVMTQLGTVYYVCSMHVSLGMKGRIFVSGLNGINDMASAGTMPYPNPADQQLHIDLASSGYFSYTITDLTGRAILQGGEYATAQRSVAVDVSDISIGNYILSVTNAEGITNRSKISIRH